MNSDSGIDACLLLMYCMFVKLLLVSEQRDSSLQFILDKLMNFSGIDRKSSYMYY